MNKKRFFTLISILMVLTLLIGSIPVSAKTSKPSKPSISIEVKDVTSEKATIVIKIGKTKNAAGYEIYEKAASEENYKKIKTLKESGDKKREYGFDCKLSDKKVYIKVRAYNGSKYGKYSAVKKIKLSDYIDNSGSKDTTTVAGREVNKLPYTTNGLKITDISFDSWSATVTVKNETGGAIDSLSSITYKCYNSKGTVVSSGNMYLEDTNKGESCKGTIIVDSNVTKIVFGSGDVRKGSKKEDKDTTVISGREVNKLPYTTNGLTITAISFDSWSATVTVKNETGAAIDSLSSIAYKCYNSKGTVVSSGNMYLEDANKGESCNATIIVDGDVTKIVFGSGDVRKGSKKEDKDTTVISGYVVNKLPYTTNGLTITAISFDSWSATVTVKNETGDAIDSLSSIAYKCYDSKGTVISSGNMYLEDINKGESCNATVIVDSSVTKILFDSGSVKKGTARKDKDTTTISGKTVNKLPYTTNGLTITAISFDSWSANIIVKNETGDAIDSLSSIAYKCYDSKGTVVSSGNMYLEELNKGESCKGTVIVDSDVSKIIFDTGSVRKGTARIITKDTTTISGRTVNKLPYKTNGLTITAISFDSWSATVTVKNETGSAIDSLSSIAYKCYDSDGIVVSSGNMYLEDSNKGESCEGKVIVDSDVKKLIFFDASVRKK